MLLWQFQVGRSSLQCAVHGPGFQLNLPNLVQVDEFAFAWVNLWQSVSWSGNAIEDVAYSGNAIHPHAFVCANVPTATVGSTGVTECLSGGTFVAGGSTYDLPSGHSSAVTSLGGPFCQKDVAGMCVVVLCVFANE